VSETLFREVARLARLVDGETVKQFIVLAEMSLWSRGPHVWPSIATIGRLTGTRQDATVRKRNQQLQEVGAIRMEMVPGRPTRYYVTALEVGDSADPRGSTTPDLNTPEDQQPIKAVDQMDQPSEPSPPAQPGRWSGVIRRVERWASNDEQPTRPAEPVEQSGGAAPAADAPSSPPPKEEQPRTLAPVVTDVFTAQNPPPSERGETWAEVHGLPEPEDNSFARTLFWKACKPTRDGRWDYRGELLDAITLLNRPGAKMAGITLEDLKR
jgi:hypothetical protein